MNRTHWLPPFTVRQPDGLQRAICGQFITAAQHSTQPTCWGCAAYLDNVVNENVPHEPARVLADILPASPWGIERTA